MKSRAFGQERLPFDWKDPQFGYEVTEITYEEAVRLLVAQQWEDTLQEDKNNGIETTS